MKRPLKISLCTFNKQVIFEIIQIYRITEIIQSSQSQILKGLSLSAFVPNKHKRIVKKISQIFFA